MMQMPSLIFFFLLLIFVVAFLAVSLVFLILTYFADSLFGKIVLVAGVIFLGLILGILFQSYINRELVGQSKFPICHDMLTEFKLCGRCIGFYAGLTLFGALVTIKNALFIDLLKMIGPYPYLVVTFLVITSVPIHGTLRRLKIVKSKRLVHLVGFLFSSSIFLVGSALISILYGG